MRWITVRTDDDSFERINLAHVVRVVSPAPHFERVAIHLTDGAVVTIAGDSPAAGRLLGAIDECEVA